jgi:hypothetical protein
MAERKPFALEVALGRGYLLFCRSVLNAATMVISGWL